MAKNRLPEEGSQSYTWSPLEEDVVSCPVRALRIYVQRTQETRRSTDPLFVSVTKAKNTSPQFISGTLRNIMKEAYLAVAADEVEIETKVVGQPEHVGSVSPTHMGQPGQFGSYPPDMGGSPDSMVRYPSPLGSEVSPCLHSPS